MIDTRELRINNIVNANINNSSRFITIVGIQKSLLQKRHWKKLIILGILTIINGFLPTI